MTEPRNRRILIVDDNPAIHEDIRKILDPGSRSPALEELEAALFGATPSPAPTYDLASVFQGADALAAVTAGLARGERFALAFVDMRMPPGWDGIETIARLWEVDPALQVVLCTAFSDYSWEEILARLGTTDRLLILKKPFDPAEVCQLACALTEKWRLARGAELTLDALHAMVDAQTLELSAHNERLTAERARMQDVLTELKSSEEALRAGESRYRALVENIPDVTWTRDTEGNLHYISPNVERLCGYSQEEFLTTGTTLTLSRVHAEDLGTLRAAAEGLMRGVPMDIEYRFQHKSGRWVLLRNRASGVRKVGERHYIDGISTDVTERRALEARLRQAQKMEAIGRLAGGVAHDFNNLLSVILGYSHMLSEALPADDPMREDLGEIRRAGERATNLTRQLLAFSRKQVLQPRVVDLNEILAGMQRMLGRLLGEDIDLSIAADPSLGRVHADPGQIEQVIMNLAVNARDAMPRGGRLRLETSNAQVDAPGREGAAGVMLTVTDTGEGMDAATQARIFEPFFTTREQGKGTGLGLSTAFGIIEQSGGTLEVFSVRGEGTTFKVCLPRVERPMGARGEIVEAEVKVGGNETILLVEDEALVRKVAETVLRRHGYVVIAARDGPEAMRLCEARGGEIDLLLTDVVMPGMSGGQLAERLLPLRPSLKVLFMSGYNDDRVVRDGILHEEIAFLQKPFTPAAMLRKVREVLDAPPRPPRAVVG